jgi:hypothetical protein
MIAEYVEKSKGEGNELLLFKASSSETYIAETKVALKQLIHSHQDKILALLREESRYDALEWKDGASSFQALLALALSKAKEQFNEFKKKALKKALDNNNERDDDGDDNDDGDDDNDNDYLDGEEKDSDKDETSDDENDNKTSSDDDSESDDDDTGKRKKKRSKHDESATRTLPLEVLLEDYYFYCIFYEELLKVCNY